MFLLRCNLGSPSGLASVSSWGACLCYPHVICMCMSRIIDTHAFLERFVYSCQKVDYKEKQRKIVHPLVHFLTGHKTQDWARPEPGAGNFFQVSHWVQEPKCLGRPPLLSEAISWELGQK